MKIYQASRNSLRHWVLAALVFGWQVTAPSWAGPFEQGSKRLSLVIGSGQAFNEDYTIAGAGFGYYVIDGLELGIDYQAWLGGEPSIAKLSPQLQYVYSANREIRPYIGIFYRRTYIDGYDDQDATGGRLGVIFSGQDAYYLGVGIAHENTLDCNEAVYVSCSDTYPEVSFTFLL